MSRHSTYLLTITALAAGIVLPSVDAAGQRPSLKDQVVGSWSYVSADNIAEDGKRQPLFGPNPQGFAQFDRDGHYILLVARSDLPKFTSNNRIAGTPEEYKAVVQGSIAHFGQYAVDEADQTITFHIETSTFPNWNGADQKRPLAVTADELKWTTVSSTGGSAEVVLKRLK